MPVIATPIIDPKHGRGEEYRVGVKGATAKRWYHVNAADVASAMRAFGLPAIGDPWHATLAPDVLAVAIGSPQCLGGRVGTLDERIGHCFIPVDYATSEASVIGIPIGPNDKWTDVLTGVASLNIRYGISKDSAGNDLHPGNSNTTIPIANGDGVSRDVGFTTYKVSSFKALADPNLGAYQLKLSELQAEQALNDAPVHLPRYRGGQQLPSVKPAKSLRYQGFEGPTYLPSRGLFQFTHTLLYAKDHRALWKQPDKDGNVAPDAPDIGTWTYATRSFGGIF